MRAPHAVAVALLVACAARGALAQSGPSPQDKILAQTLFEDGRAKMSAGDFAAACPKLAESYRLDPAPGTFLNLGLCHESEGRLATAYAELTEALSRAIRDGRADRQKTARDHIAAIAPKLSKLKLSVAPAAPPDLHVAVDGTMLARAAWDVAIPMDPGEHVVVASASGRLPSETRITIAADGSTQEVSLGELANDPNPPPVATTTRPTPPPVKPPPEAPKDPSTASPLRSVGIATIAVGGAALVSFGIFGAFAMATWSKVDSQCPNGACPTDAAIDDGRRAGTLADLATASLIVGSVLAVGGIVLVLVAPSAKQTAWISPTGPGFVFGTTF